MTPNAAVQALLVSDPAARSLGVSIRSVDLGRVTLAMTAPETSGNAHGIVHGGTLFTLADTAFAYALATYGRAGVTTGATISFLAPARVGSTLVATATEFFFDRTTGIFDVAVTDEAGAVLAAFRGQGRIPRVGV